MMLGASGGRGLKIALAVSLAANLLVVGVVAGGWLRRAVDGGPPSVERLLREGDAGQRARLQAIVDQRTPDFEARRATQRAARATVREVATAEPFDAAALDTALAALRAADGAVAEARHRTFAALIAEMPPERRAEVVARFGRMLGERRRGGSHHDRD
jgi:Spy/CpxP family protein refolding chaperone